MKSEFIVLSVLVLPVACMAEQRVNFNRDVRPILSDRCFHCHGPNGHDRQAGLRLDQAEGDGAAQVLEPGSPDDSELWYRITSEDDDVMPPPDSPKKPLTENERNIIKRWIEEGAEYTDFWAFVPPKKSNVPAAENQRWSQQAIDQFVLRTLEAENQTPNPAADRRTLIRRLSLDLTGLPPTRNEIQTFLTDESPDAYERLVDRLLAKPHYGEHMTKYWLDLVRFADTNGIHHDHYREMTPYRDWVIRAFNENLPYDKFVMYQLAGDLYPSPERDQLIASGFHRLHLIIDVGTALPEESYTRNVVDRVTAVGTAFMGVTVQCAVCHDHKYDPITTKDFYQLYAFFNNLDGAPETGGRRGSDFERGLQAPYISLATDVQQEKLTRLDSRIASAKTQIQLLERRVKEAAKAAEKDGGAKEAPEKEEAEKKEAGKEEAKASGAKEVAEKTQLDEELKQAQEALAKVQAEKAAFEASIPVAMVMKERAEVRPAHILLRGAYDNPGEEVERNTPAFLPPMRQEDGMKTRMDLAEWFVDPAHPLTARVAVNRFWQQLFGVGIVKTSEDFGAQGDWPSHPELLDYLAVSFVESGWDVKALLKQVVMSETYKQTSKASPKQFEVDPENRLLARGSRYRMDSEMIRDQLLATSGLLNSELYGKSVKPPQPQGLWQTVSMPSSYPRIYEADVGNKIYRRSVYTFWKRGMPPPQMTILNAPTREACIARRERTNTPLQALLLMNEPEYLKAAKHLATEAITASATDYRERLAVIYETITSQLPDESESKTLLKMARDLEAIYRDKPEQANLLCEGHQLPEGISASEWAAWTMLTSTVYNLDITKTRN